MRDKPNQVTMHDVAKAAGVSRMTVSRALKENSPVSKETRDRILKIVRDMNYVLDQQAGSLTTKKSGFVALLLPSLNNLHFALTMQGMTEALDGTGLQILLGHTGYSMEQEERVVETLLRRRPEAFVLSYDGHTDRTRHMLAEAGVPVIEIWEQPEDPIEYTVGFSNFQAAYDMTAALIEQGMTELVFFCEQDDYWTRGASRRRGFVKAMRDHGLSADAIFRYGAPPLRIEDGSMAAPKLLNQFPDAECIFAVSDPAAFGLVNGLKTLGKSVPEDIKLVGFGDFEVSRFSTPTLSTVVVDPIGIGMACGDLLKTLLVDENDDQIDKHHAVKVELDFRQSTHPGT